MKSNDASGAEHTVTDRPHSGNSLPGIDARKAIGRSQRTQRARSVLGQWEVAATNRRRDPVAILKADSAGRMRDLLPIRYGRMLATPFAFLRGAAAVMMADIGPLPNTGIATQLCGDCHIRNFGGFAGPDRRLVFGINDFDQTLPGPFEWDVKRLAASIVVAAR